MAVFPPAEVRARAGSVDVAFGRSAIRFADGRYELSIFLPDVDVGIELSVVPETLPLLTNNLALTDGRPLCWLATHSLRAWGVVRCRDVLQTYEGAPAYHDHNWGYFRWGDDFAWEWGTLLHDRKQNPYSLSFVRIMDRARLRVTVASVYLWEGARLLTKISRSRSRVPPFRPRPIELHFQDPEGHGLAPARHGDGCPRASGRPLRAPGRGSGRLTFAADDGADPHARRARR